MLSRREIAPGYAPGVSLFGIQLSQRGHTLGTDVMFVLMCSIVTFLPTELYRRPEDTQRRVSLCSRLLPD